MRVRHLAIGVTLALLCAFAPAGAVAQGWVTGVTFLPSSPTTLDRVQIAVTVDGYVTSGKPPDVSASTIRIDTTTYQGPPGIPFTTYNLPFVVGPLAAGTYPLTVYLDGSPTESSLITVTQGTPVSDLLLSEGRFRATVTLQDPRTTSSAYATSSSDQCGYFWFFDPSNVELTVKVLDGRAVNGHFWVFV
ncbi:MAG TPA: hypothetical protein VN999_11480, partial [Thermoanaerobaculia bacterium]|nr:hypothetical protein [Thermoanaerobaculia bacterium]